MFKPGDDPDLFLFRLDAYIAANNKDSNTVYKNLVLYMRWEPDPTRLVSRILRI